MLIHTRARAYVCVRMCVCVRIATMRNSTGMIQFRRSITLKNTNKNCSPSCERAAFQKFVARKSIGHIISNLNQNITAHIYMPLNNKNCQEVRHVQL